MLTTDSSRVADVKKASLYWIRHADHSDIMSEGYVGITSQKVEYRFRRHLSMIERGNSPHIILQSAINKHGLSNIKMSVMCVGSEEYCLDLENRLRPLIGVGWNIGIGGRATNKGLKRSEEVRVKINAHKIGKPRSQETRDKISRSLVGNNCASGSVRSPQYMEELIARNKQYKHTPEAKAKISEASKLMWSKKRATTIS